MKRPLAAKFTWPSGGTESAHLNHWTFIWKTKTCRDQHENIKRKLISRNNNFRVNFIITIRRCLESFCVFSAICCHSMVLAAVVCLYLLFVTNCSLVLCRMGYHLLWFAGIGCRLLLCIYCHFLQCVAICNYLLLFAIISWFLQPFVLLLLGAICCYLPPFSAAAAAAAAADNENDDGD